MVGFDRAVDFLLNPAIEGGYVNDPRDPGGETKYGISKRAYPHVDVRVLTLAQAKAIYLNDYWLRALCSRLPDDLALVVFDCAVNQGVAASQQLLQSVLGVVPDGVVGAKTLTAMSTATNAMAFEYLQMRAMRYTRTHNYEIYKRGWLKRLFMAAQVIHGKPLDEVAAKHSADKWNLCRSRSVFEAV
jgi:lysozyme family protein